MQRTRRVLAVPGAASALVLGGLAVAALVPSQEAKLTAEDGVAADELGASVAISGDTAVTGAPAAGDATAGPGSLYVFTRSGGNWSQRRRLFPSDGADGDFFGGACAIDAGTIVVGAQGFAGQQGQAYVFEGDGSAWSETEKLAASDAGAFERFGQAVAIDGDTLVVGAPAKSSFRGAAYVFVRGASGWTEQQKLTASDAAASDQFGAALAIRGDTILVGAAGHASGRGAAYVFTRAGSTWTERATLTADDGAADDFFGVAVALENGTALVGSQLADIGDHTNQGAAYVFTGAGADWTQETRLLRTQGSASDNFGLAVSIHEGTALVGAVFASPIAPNPVRGAAVAFRRGLAGWAQVAELVGDDIAADDQFGSAVAIHAGTAVVGAIGQASLRGAAYAFKDLPASELAVTVRKGAIADSPKAGKDKVSATADVRFRDAAGAFDPGVEGIEVRVGGSGTPFVAAFPTASALRRTTSKRGLVTHTYTTPKGVAPKVKLTVAIALDGSANVALKASALTLGEGAASGPVSVGVSFGEETGDDRDAWRTKGAKRLYP